MAAHTPNPSISEVEAGRGGGEFQASLIYLVRLCFKKKQRERERERKEKREPSVVAHAYTFSREAEAGRRIRSSDQPREHNEI